MEKRICIGIIGILAACLMPSGNAATQQKLIIDGIYRMEVVIANKTFVDFVELKSMNAKELSGTVTLPSVFTAPLTGKYEFDERINAGHIRFDISTLEKGNALKVSYEGTLKQIPKSNRVEFVGEATGLQDSKVFGKIHAEPLIRAKTESL